MGANKNELIGQSAAMRDVRRLIEISAPAKTTVLVLGDTGTGKELVANSIHTQSARKGNLISVNCSAIPAMVELDEIKSLVNFSGDYKSDNLVNECLCGNIAQYKKVMSELYERI